MFGNALMLAAPTIQQLSGVTNPLPTITITQDMLTPVVDGIVANISAALPIGLGIFTLFMGIKIVPSFLARFARF